MEVVDGDVDACDGESQGVLCVVQDGSADLVGLGEQGAGRVGREGHGRVDGSAVGDGCEAAAAGPGGAGVVGGAAQCFGGGGLVDATSQGGVAAGESSSPSVFGPYRAHDPICEGRAPAVGSLGSEGLGGLTQEALLVGVGGVVGTVRGPAGAGPGPGRVGCVGRAVF
ncbi:hypothetical protein [Kitasatospora sp. NPDC007106]|uniref:hypothetical protein n=1 Tax=Kitasatospora sp. NPDC007106 TaxID=3156914 RepID=UPI0033E91F0A